MKRIHVWPMCVQYLIRINYEDLKSLPYNNRHLHDRRKHVQLSPLSQNHLVSARTHLAFSVRRRNLLVLAERWLLRLLRRRRHLERQVC